MKLTNRLFFLFLALGGAILAAGPLAADVHVSQTGSDTDGDGSTEAPFATLQRALQEPDDVILMEGGQYLFQEPLTIPAGKTIKGGYQQATFPDGEFRWERDSEPTFFLTLSIPGRAAFKLESGARFEWLTIAGGFYSVELAPGAEVKECEFLGGEFSAILVREGTSNQPSIIDRVRIRGGASGIRMDTQANVAVLDSLIEDTASRGIFATGSGIIGIYHTVIQRTGSDAIAIQGNSNVLVENCVLRRNTGAGVRVSQCAPTIRGSLVELNENGVSLLKADDAVVENCTIVRNRRAGIAIREGQPSFRRNAIVKNSGYGVFEDKPDPIIVTDDDGTTSSVPFPTHVAQLSNNIFWQNTPGEYFDEGENAYSIEEEIQNLVVNAESPSGNRVVDPGFLDEEEANYRPGEGSPMIDAAPVPEEFENDLGGNPRLIDIPNVGNTTTNAADIGAFEYQPGLVRRFGSLYADERREPGLADPSENVLVRESPEWLFKEFQGFEVPEVQMLPGRLRVASTEDGSFGEIFRDSLDYNPQANELVRLRTTMFATEDVGQQFTRFRFNGPEALDTATTFSYLGTREVAPTVEGANYELIADIRQGGYQSVPPSEKSEYQAAFYMDVIDFQDLTVRVPQDMTSFEIDHLDRDTFNQQFTEQVQSWDFQSSVGHGWQTEFIPGGLFNNPRLRYNGIVDALELTQTGPNSFGFWKSPGIPIRSGALYRIDFTVSTPETIGETPWFRFRTSTTFFEFSQELLIQPFPAGQAGPDGDGEVYTLYGRMPEVLEEVYEDTEIELVLYLDMFGFAVDRPTDGTIYLEDVKVWTTAP